MMLLNVYDGAFAKLVKSFQLLSFQKAPSYMFDRCICLLIFPGVLLDDYLSQKDKELSRKIFLSLCM